VSSALDKLIEAPEEVNPALLAAWYLREMRLHGELRVSYLIGMAGRLEEAQASGQKMLDEGNQVVDSLRKAAADTSPIVPVGF
jgi:hypothetical protein